MADVVDILLLEQASAILAVGTCAAYGGIPAGNPNPTGAKGVLDFAKAYQLPVKDRKKTINIPGCPPNPNWIVGTIAYLIANGLRCHS